MKQLRAPPRPARPFDAGPTLLITCTLAVALVYWEGGVLLRALRERRAAEAARRRREQEARRRQRGAGIFGSWDSTAGGADDSSGEGSSGEEGGVGWDASGWGDWGPEPPPASLPQEPTRVERARHERRRSLGYLALVTTVLIWMTGVVSGPTPFQP